ncbi:hypothetical protein MS2017_1187 [Bathymodiolus thermophilus thioautotrophic gill symbiont]|uniref:Uncharacterized protein n=1 Tax=Bathymodiolus thermophilus thioautotrophic gill symbiont TaxID=2360 RepID=A0A3G3IM05_9GAMM|nr:hypothetical protein [Bathymodiolus thermophilus thioautotrophic gill symbiont]AYQ56887.1 hypothetical protein MS2017_1187 [Bathymodiolus thermophilus thioautotrophic gill symbiont]
MQYHNRFPIYLNINRLVAEMENAQHFLGYCKYTLGDKTRKTVCDLSEVLKIKGYVYNCYKQRRVRQLFVSSHTLSYISNRPYLIYQ